MIVILFKFYIGEQFNPGDTFHQHPDTGNGTNVRYAPPCRGSYNNSYRSFDNLNTESPIVSAGSSSDCMNGRLDVGRNYVEPRTSGAGTGFTETRFQVGTTNGSEKPPYSYVAMISFAIKDSDNGKLTLNGIYQYIVDHFPYFKEVSQQHCSDFISGY